MISSDYRDIQLDNSVIALGKFQGLHKGHMLLIDEIIKLSFECDIPSVIFSINMPGEKVINVNDERAFILEKKGIDYKADCEFTQEFAGLSPKEFVENVLVERFHASYVVVGEDFRFGSKRAGDVETLREFGEEFGFEVIAFDKLTLNGQIISTTLLKDLISEGKVDVANDMMGRAYHITGIVTEGKKLGRTIGFPTVNIVPKEEKFLPKLGVYRTNVIIEDKKYHAMTNVGNNPTVDGVHGIFVETHIFDFDEDIYGKQITVEFISYIREQVKFESVELLVEQLKRDKEYIQSLY